MNSEAIMHEFVSRPKINRLPFEPARSNFNFASLLDGEIIRWPLAGVASLVLLFIIYQYGSDILTKPAPHPDDDKLIEAVDSPADTIKSGSSTLYFRDNDGVIVGDMVKIASESEKTIPDKVYGNSSNSNATTESELLSILSKY